MDILSDVGIKGNLSLNGDMNVYDDFGINHCGSKLKISGVPNERKISLKTIDSSGWGFNMYIRPSVIEFYQSMLFHNNSTFKCSVVFNRCSYFENSINLVCKASSGNNVSLSTFYGEENQRYLDINSPVITDDFYKRTPSDNLMKINNKFCLTVPENCTKFHIFEGSMPTCSTCAITEINFLPVINSYEITSEGCLKKVDMDIFVTNDSIIGERVSTEQKDYFFSFYLA